ncbi:hypothetical protein NK553_04805 [Pseudomonas sp. ZM23]|uniref:Uncharacterized protein n=1 Tax=Pseudomonas triclosanedens TaxID=2961893 RepID=A0ABY6ZUV0_9PSED|nr:hypothetical protein [Pseudomonas triclosanedens]MCP8463264.1 hypothetical protein [Pseudomonas triclosanedens]MCP8469677.1 hypothetical protein [Pseudomonas triclosanedens]MCP8474066.1 hypothetical protein [Pseudomonas triclosanedens]WAI48538.1 hypothetical protein OU419_22690 [Pseudomonas triclosanedens]
MGEPCQLYLRVAISRERLDEFLRSEAGAATEFEDLRQWLQDHRKWRTPFTWPELCELGEGTCAAAWITGWRGHLRSPACNHYDEATQTWTLAVLEFADSLDWIVGGINVLRRIADFKDLPGTDLLLLYEYLFEQGEVVAAVELTIGHSRILPGEPAPGMLTEANRAMNALLRAMDVSGRYNVQRISDETPDRVPE